MNSKLWIRNAVTMCLMVALIATYSMVALASDGRAAGELVINSSETSLVTVNGEVAKSGRAIFSSSTISTPEGTGATVNLGKAGRIELAPSTTFTLSFDENTISGSLTSGSITVLNAAHSVGVRTLSGDLVQVNAGETANATSSSASTKPAATASRMEWEWWALIVGGAVAAIIITTATRNKNRFGGTATTVSPVR